MIFTKMFLLCGLVLNSVFILIIYKKRLTKKFQSPKPFRHILIAILLCDMAYLLNESDVWNKPIFTSYNGICQLNTYLNALFAVLHEFHMLYASYILFRITFKKANTSMPIKTHESLTENEPQTNSNALKQNHNSLNEIICLENQKIESNNAKKILKGYSLKTPLSPKISKLKKTQSLTSRLSARLKAKTKSSTVSLLSNFKTDYWQRIQSKKYRMEEVYYNLIIKEKQFITLNSVFWIYMLSFLIWTHGVENLKENSGRLIIESSFSFLEKILSEKIARKNPNAYITFEDSQTVSNSQFCIVYEFAFPIFKIYSFFINFLRLFTLFVNILVSMLHHAKFRKEYFESMMRVFDHKASSISSAVNIKKFTLKKLNIFYTTHNLKNNAFIPRSNESSVDFINNGKNIQSHYDHIHFLRHYAKIIFVYSLLIAPSIFKENLAIIRHNFYYTELDRRTEFQNKALILLKVLSYTPNSFNSSISVVGKEEFDQIKNEWLNNLIYFSTILAHSTKLIFYLTFSFHLKVFLKTK